jgi:hypothetical protein
MLTITAGSDGQSQHSFPGFAVRFATALALPAWIVEKIELLINASASVCAAQ